MTGPVIYGELEQGSEEWHAARAGIPTASEFSKILAKGQGKTRRSYMLRLAGERLTGQPTEPFTNSYMERGHEMEPEARRLYAFLHDMEPVQVGFIRNGDRGYSPDGLCGDSGLVEIKTRKPELQIDLLLCGEVPSEHTAQLQGGLWVAEREWIDFVSYWPGLPLFHKRVHRDERYISNLAGEVARFNDELAALVEQIRVMDRPAEAA